MEIIVLTGPTGVGKTALSIDIALAKGLDIISADSRQVYKYMDIGTGKIMPSQMKGVKHYLIDIIDPDKDFNAFDFVKEAKTIIENNNKVMIVGGTIFYIKALFDSLIGAPSVDNFMVANIIRKYKQSKIETYKELLEKDPQAACKIHINDEYRVTRALSVIYMTGKKYSSYKMKQEVDLKPRYMILNIDRESLYKKINKRVDSMIELGLFKEVETILNMGFDQKLKSLNTLGYKEAIEFLNGDISQDEAICRMKKETRHFAKRQITALRSLKENFYTQDEILKIFK